VLFIRLSRPLPTGVIYKARKSEDENEDAYDSFDAHTQYMCVCFECKRFSKDKIEFEGNRVKVRYDGRVHDATEQSFQQQVSLRNYLQKNKLHAPYIFHLLWLTSVVERDLPDITHNIIASDTSWKTILNRIYNTRPCRWNSLFEVYEFYQVNTFNPSYITKAVSALTDQIEKSPLDRKRIEVITRKVIKDQKYGEQLGKQLLMFRGRGGTGKTVRLLRLAYQMYEEKDGKILLLTYNRALVTDIRRLLGLMGVNQAFAEKSISIRTIHSFMGSILHYFEISLSDDKKFYESYPGYKKELLSYIESKAITKSDVRDAMENRSDSFDWDHIFIDESQDWPIDERDILFFMYNYQRFVLADGVDQLVRSYTQVNWRQHIVRDLSQVVTLKQSLRLKDGLCRFIHAFANQMGLTDWEIEANPEIYGGKVIIVEGKYSSSREIHDFVLSQHEQAGNKPIDMLICVPPTLAQRSKRGEKSIVAAKLQEWDFQVWDGTVELVRENPPSTLEQFRVIQYESCRGFEGWTVVNLGFDELYDHKFQKYDFEDIQQRDLYTESSDLSHNYATKWLMIPLTRGIDTLVIHVSSSEHKVTQALRAAAEQCEDVVEWRKV
jgi:hypothetical protein